MTFNGVGRVGLDKAIGIIGTGANTVFTNNKKTTINSSIITNSPNKGDIIVSSQTTVYAENKNVAVQGSVTARGYAIQRASENVFAGNGSGPIDPLIVISPAIQIKLDSENRQYISAQRRNPTSPNQYFSIPAQSNGVKANFPGTPNDGRSKDPEVSSLIREPRARSIIDFLKKCLEEANNGLWRETGQGGRPSNPNIVGIWANLGYASSGMWASDQTPWCMGFINFVLKACGYRYVQTAWAPAIIEKPQLWRAMRVPNDQAEPGDIVYWSFGHVSFVYTENKGKYTFVGGNQTPKGGNNNNPNDGDVTISWPGGLAAGHPSWVSTWRPSKI